MATEGFVFPRGFASKFYAYRLGNQAIPSGVNTLVQLNALRFDALDEFDETVNFRFVPKQAGYYFFKGQGYIGALALNQITRLQMQRTGTVVSEDIHIHNGATSRRLQTVWFGYMTLAERMELYVYQNSGAGQNLITGWHVTHLQGFRVA